MMLFQSIVCCHCQVNLDYEFDWQARSQRTDSTIKLSHMLIKNKLTGAHSRTVRTKLLNQENDNDNKLSSMTNQNLL